MATVAKPPKHDAPQLQVNDDGSASGSNFYELLFPDSADKPFEVKAKNGTTFKWTPTELVYKDDSGNLDYIVGSSPSSLNVLKNQARYARTFPDADDFFHVEGESVKHWTILNEPPRDPGDIVSGTIYFGVSGTVNGIPLPTGEHNRIDTDVFKFPKPIVKDVAGNEIEGFYEVVDSTDGQQLFIWFEASFLDTAVYPIMIDPTVVVSSAYSTKGNGGRKLIQLDNGDLVATALDTYDVYLYKSSDEGSTWSQLCYANGGSMVDASLETDGNMVYLLFGDSSNTAFFFHTIDPSTQTNTNIWSTDNIFDDTTTDGVGNCSLIRNANGTELHAAWASKNSTYPDSFNIRYAKGTIETDGSVTWGSVEQVTTEDDSTSDGFKYPTIVVLSGGFPQINCIYTYSNRVFSFSKAHSNQEVTWSSVPSNWGNATIHMGGSNEQTSPSAIFVPSSVNGLTDGRIWVAWASYEGNAGERFVAVSYSDDSGANWSSKNNLTEVDLQNNYPSITAHNSNEVVIVFQGENSSNSYAGNVRVIKHSNGSWGTIQNLTDWFENGDSNPSALFDPTFTINFIPFIYEDPEQLAVMYDDIQYNQPPDAPTNLDPAGGESIDRATVTRLSWQHNDPDGDPQSKFDLQWREKGTSTWNDVTQSTSNQYWDAAASTFSRGDIEWRVRTYDQDDEVGPYSDIATFYAGDKPATPEITDPTDGSTVSVANPTVQWSSSGQVGYHLKVLDDKSTLVWEHKNESSTSKTKTIEYDLQNNTNYTIELAIINADGLWSDFDSVGISVSFTPPATPTVDVVTSDSEAIIVLNITNPVPSGSEPTVDYNNIYRRKYGESTWKRIATEIPANESYTDYTPASGQQYEYYVRAWGDNGTYTDSAIVTGEITLKGIWLHDVTDPESLHQFKTFELGRNADKSLDGSLMEFEGRDLPMANFSPREQKNVQVTLQIQKDSGDMKAIRDLINRRSTLCYRDARGRRIFCVIFALPETDELWGYTVPIDVQAVYLDEEV